MARLHEFADKARTVVAVVPVVLAAALKVDAAKWEARVPAIGKLITDMQEGAWWAIPASMAVVAGLTWVKHLATPPALIDGLKEACEHYRKKLNPSNGTANYDYRVTVFQRRGFALSPWRTVLKGGPWRGWMVPLVRTGWTHEDSGTAFAAPNAAHLAEGVAGQAWAGKRILETNLPAITRDSPDKKIAEYAKRTLVSDPRIIRNRLWGRRLLALSIAGFPIMVKQRAWGSLVIDSTDPAGVKAEHEADYQALAEELARIIRGSGGGAD